ncbi:hypothetical protein U9M48_028789 [Paspalum notatum var. saurae]|uniref:Uncharacterized protein n=1 Tax=Paspalum notatum var. saurae TaxID=547442 RepID=A0AAQ3TY00_PASNO
MPTVTTYSSLWNGRPRWAGMVVLVVFAPASRRWMDCTRYWSRPRMSVKWSDAVLWWSSVCWHARRMICRVLPAPGRDDDGVAASAWSEETTFIQHTGDEEEHIEPDSSDWTLMVWYCCAPRTCWEAMMHRRSNAKWMIHEAMTDRQRIA